MEDVTRGEIWYDCTSGCVELILSVAENDMGEKRASVARYYPNGALEPATVDSVNREDWELDMVQLTSLQEIAEMYEDVRH